MAKKKRGLGDKGNKKGAKPDALEAITGLDDKPPVKREKKKNLTCSLTPATIDKLQSIGYWDRVPMSSVIEEMLETGIKRLEKKRGEPYEPIPKGNKLKTGRPAKV